MPDLPWLPRSELEVARIVWKLKRASVRDVVDALPSDRSLDFSTVQTYLRRLEQKGILTVRRVGRSNVYAPKIKPDRVVRHAVHEFLDQLFDGDALPLMQHLLRREQLTPAQLDELQQELDELQDNKGD